MPTVTRAKPAADAVLRSALTSFMMEAVSGTIVVALGDKTAMHASQLGRRKNRVVLATINRYSERLVRAFKAANREHVRRQPDRQRRGAADTGLRAITPKVEKALRP